MIDDEIKGALNVDSSPEFLARVRTRIANEPAPSAWRWSWRLSAAGVLAAAVIVAVIWRPIESRRDPFGPGVPANPSASTGLAEARGSGARAEAKGPALHENSVVSGFSRTMPRNPSDSTVRLKPDTTEVPLLFDHSEMRALQALIAAAKTGGVALTQPAEAAPLAPMELEPVTEIVIAPITIDPIAPQSGAEGVRQ